MAQLALAPVPATGAVACRAGRDQHLSTEPRGLLVGVKGGLDCWSVTQQQVGEQTGLGLADGSSSGAAQGW